MSMFTPGCEIAQGGMIVWTTAQGPVVLALLFSDRQVVDARDCAAASGYRRWSLLPHGNGALSGRGEATGAVRGAART